MPSRDTTTFLVSNVIHALARRPESWKRLHQETLALGSQPLTFKVLNLMKFLQWIINESVFRTYPSLSLRLI